jgi:hypothetical protein
MRNDPGLAEAFADGPLTGNTDTYDRVRGLPRRFSAPPIALPGNVWPVAPAPVVAPLLEPQTREVQSAFSQRLSQARHHRGGFGLCQAAASQADKNAALPQAPGAALGLCYAKAPHVAADAHTL